MANYQYTSFNDIKGRKNTESKTPSSTSPSLSRIGFNDILYREIPDPYVMALAAQSANRAVDDVIATPAATNKIGLLSTAGQYIAPSQQSITDQAAQAIARDILVNNSAPAPAPTPAPASVQTATSAPTRRPSGRTTSKTSTKSLPQAPLTVVGGGRGSYNPTPQVDVVPTATAAEVAPVEEIYTGLPAATQGNEAAKAAAAGEVAAAAAQAQAQQSTPFDQLARAYGLIDANGNVVANATPTLQLDPMTAYMQNRGLTPEEAEAAYYMLGGR